MIALDLPEAWEKLCPKFGKIYAWQCFWGIDFIGKILDHGRNYA